MSKPRKKITFFFFTSLSVSYFFHGSTKAVDKSKTLNYRFGKISLRKPLNLLDTYSQIYEFLELTNGLSDKDVAISKQIMNSNDPTK